MNRLRDALRVRRPPRALLRWNPPTHLPPLPRVRALAFGVACSLAVPLSACRCPRLVALSSGAALASAAGATVEPGPYLDDERVERLCEQWPQLVGRAIDRLTLVTGLSLDGATPDVRLVALGDETRAFVVRAAVVDGVRTPSLWVNLERLAPGLEDVDEVLVRGLALAALEVAAARTGMAVPPWLAEAVGAAAGGALAERVERLVRDDASVGRAVSARVDPADPRHAGSTGVAVLLLLLERGGAPLVRRWLTLALDGEDAVASLRRLLGSVEMPWGEARRALGARLADVDARPWRALAAAQRALSETGRAGLLAELESSPAGEALDERSLLAASAALAEGDVEAARAALRSLSDDAGRRVREPRVLAALRVRVEAAPGGDPGVAAALLAQLERDFPRTGEATLLRAELRLPEDPRRSLAALRRQVEVRGLASLELEALVRYVDLLHQDHRNGEAQRVLSAMGDRAAAPELEALTTAVARAEREPGPAALEAARARVDVWLHAPVERTRRDVVDGGRASALALAERLASPPSPLRHATVALLGLTEGAESVRRLLPTWRQDSALLPGDLEALAESVRLPELGVWLRASAADLPAGVDVERRLEVLGLDLDPVWVREHADLVRDLRSPVVAVRRRAVEHVAEARLLARAPALVARLLLDPVPQLRREALRSAGEGGFFALVRVALDDPVPWVRRAAAEELARDPTPAACDVLLAHLRSDPAPQVRAAVGLALLDAHAADPRVVPVIVDALADDDPGLRQALLEALVGQPEGPVVDAALAALTRELGTVAPDAARVAVWFRLLERRTGRDLGTYPGMPMVEARSLLQRARERLRRTGVR